MIKYNNIDHMILKSAYKYHKKNGFPFVNLTPHELLIDFKKLLQAKPQITKRYNFEGELFYSVGTGNQGIEFCKHFFKHQYKVRVTGTMGSPYDAYTKEYMLRKAISMAFKYTGNIRDITLRTYLGRVSWHQFATNFRPVSAKAIYEKYGKNNSIVYDFSSGFGGRLSGFLASKYSMTSKYIGVDPSTPTVEGLNKMIVFLKAKGKAEIIKTTAENFCPDELKNKVDFAFSSPPYFCKELYSEDNDQSFKKYPEYKLWRLFFLRKTIKNCFKLLKPGGYFAINIANITIKGVKYPCGTDAKKIAEKVFGKQKDLLVLPMNSLFGSEDSPKKMEYIYVFQKR